MQLEKKTGEKGGKLWWGSREVRNETFPLPWCCRAPGQRLLVSGVHLGQSSLLDTACFDLIFFCLQLCMNKCKFGGITVGWGLKLSSCGLPPDAGVIDEHLDSRRCFQLGDIMGAGGNFMAGWFLLEMGARIAWCDSVCLVNLTEHPSATDLWTLLLWAQGNVFTQGEVTPWEEQRSLWLGIFTESLGLDGRAPSSLGYWLFCSRRMFPSLFLHFMPRQTVLEMQKVFQRGKSSLFQVTFTDSFYFQFLSYLNPILKIDQSLGLNYLKAWKQTCNILQVWGKTCKVKEFVII